MSKHKTTNQGNKVALPCTKVGKQDGCGKGEQGWGSYKKFITILSSQDTPFLVWQTKWIYLSSPGSKVSSLNHGDLEGQNVSTLTNVKILFSLVISQLCPQVDQILERSSIQTDETVGRATPPGQPWQNQQLLQNGAIRSSQLTVARMKPAWLDPFIIVANGMWPHFYYILH